MEENTLHKRNMANDDHLSNLSSPFFTKSSHYCGILNVQNTSWNVQDWDGIGIYQQFHIKCSESQLQRGSGRFLCLENGTWKSDLIYLPRDCKNLHEYGENNSGKDVIHQLTKGKISNLYISITLVDGRKLYELYEQFSVSNEADNYQLFLAGTASGTLGDSMMHTDTSSGDLSGMKFTTSDRDNDMSTRNCATYFKGGWWFNNCYRAFLNGAWTPDSWINPWYPMVRSGESIKETVMMIKSL
ncbi:angiopoietin-2-like [Saccostrea cucullata]|uniref:angiopoietin-2-like n=1 Tax=Saccostrea cuccullata TaxID=36930 RepID=UPI002ED06780